MSHHGVPELSASGRPDFGTPDDRPDTDGVDVCPAGEPTTKMGSLIPAIARSLQGSQELLFVLDAERRIVVVSDGMVARTGRPRAELLGRHCYEHVHGTTVPPDDCPFGGLLGESSAASVMHSDELDGDFMVTMTALRDDDATLVGALHYVTDVTEQRRAESALSESEARFRRVFDDSPVGMVTAGPDFRFRSANEAFCRMLGYSEGELCGLSFADVTHPEHLAVDVSSTRELVAGTLPVYRTEKRYVRKNGEAIWAATTISALRDTDGRFLHFLGVIEDISERRLAEEALAESERRYHSLFEDSPVAMWEEDHSAVKTHLEELAATGIDDMAAYLLEHPREYRHCLSLARGLDVNHAAVALFEAANREELLEHEDDLYPAGATSGLRHFWAAMLAGERSTTFEETNATLTGRELQVLETCTVAPEHEATFDRVYVADVDITERRRAEHALRDGEQLFRSIVENVPVAMFQCTPDGRQIYVNPQYAALFGYETTTECVETINRTSIAQGTYEVPSRRAEFVEQVRAAGGEWRTFKNRYRRKDGSVFDGTVTLCASTEADADGEGRYLYGFIQDISERKRGEEALRTSEERYRLLFEHATEGIALHQIILDDAGVPVDYRFLAANPAFERHTELVVADLVGRTAREVLPGIEDSGLIETYGAVALTGEPAHLTEYVAVLKRHFEIAAFRVEPGKFATVFVDITGRKRAEELLYRYQLLAAEARDIFLFVRGADGAIVEANAAAETAYGYSREELLRLTIDDLRIAEDGLVIDRQLRSAGDEGILFETVHRRKDGSSFAAEVSSRGATLIDGDQVLLSVIRDITGRKQAEAALVESAAQLKLTLKAAVAALGATTEMRDPYTAGHQRRVAELAGAVAAELGWSQVRIETLQTAALLLDVGKVVVPAEILAKPGRLSEVEMNLVRQHAAAGAETVAGIDFEGDVAAAIGQHHERLDGSGYPAGLSGDQILPEARVLAVCDVVEAMISHRPYRAALPLEAAMTELENGAGRIYDAAACAACIKLFREDGLTISD